MARGSRFRLLWLRCVVHWRGTATECDFAVVDGEELGQLLVFERNPGNGFTSERGCAVVRAQLQQVDGAKLLCEC